MPRATPSCCCCRCCSAAAAAVLVFVGGSSCMPGVPEPPPHSKAISLPCAAIANICLVAGGLGAGHIFTCEPRPATPARLLGVFIYLWPSLLLLSHPTNSLLSPRHYPLPTIAQTISKPSPLSTCTLLLRRAFRTWQSHQPASHNCPRRPPCLRVQRMRRSYQFQLASTTLFQKPLPIGSHRTTCKPQSILFIRDSTAEQRARRVIRQ